MTGTKAVILIERAKAIQFKFIVVNKIILNSFSHGFHG